MPRDRRLEHKYFSVRKTLFFALSTVKYEIKRDAIQGKIGLKICYADDYVSILTERFLKHFRDRYNLHVISFLSRKIESITFHGLNRRKFRGSKVFSSPCDPQRPVNF